MNLEPTSDQQEILSGLARLLERFPAPSGLRLTHLDGAPLDEALAEAGFHGLGEIGALDSALALHDIARQPFPVEFGATIFAPLVLQRDLPRPIAWINGEQPARFLPQARSAILVNGAEINLVEITPGDARKLDSLYAYPMGVLTERRRGTELSDEQARQLRKFHKLWVAIEMCGAMRACLDATVAHVTLRRQFGRPLGSFQALQHRLAADAVWIDAAWLLCQRAAWSGQTTDIEMGLRQALAAAHSMTHDAHQFHGAIGLTLEHPLHHFSYRIGVLRSELAY